MRRGDAAEAGSAALLRSIVAKLDPVLVPHRFSFQHEHEGRSSGGAFANGFYVRGETRIGLIVRDALGQVVYEQGEGSMGHTDYMGELGHAETCRFVFDEERWIAVDRNGGAPVDALIHDLQTFAGDFLRGDLNRFSEALAEARARWLRRLSGNRTDDERGSGT